MLCCCGKEVLLVVVSSSILAVSVSISGGSLSHSPEVREWRLASLLYTQLKYRTAFLSLSLSLSLTDTAAAAEGVVAAAAVADQAPH